MKKVFCFLLLLLVCSFSWSANHYIRDGAAGTNDGTDWTDAWEDMDDITWGGAGVVRGDIIYIADGSYIADTFSLAASGSTYVYIKKAIVADHGTETGWDNGYGDGQADFARPLTFSTNYWEFNGQVGSGKSGYGFRINPPGSPSADNLHLMVFSGDRSYITIKYTDMESAGSGYDYYQTCLYSAVGGDHHTIANNYIHESGRFILTRSWSDCVIEKNYFENNWSSVRCHGDGISAHNELNNIIRWNIIENGTNDGFYTPGHGTPTGLSATNVQMYGNLIFDVDGTTGGPFEIGSEFYVENCSFFNNTIVDFGSNQAGVSGFDQGDNSATNLCRNNLWYNCDAIALGTTHDYNAFDDGTHSEANGQGNITSGFFTNYAGNVFTLTQATDAGTETGSPAGNSVDIVGVARAVDGVWDRGAYEFDSGATPPSERLVMVLLSQIQVMPIFWAWYAMAWAVLGRILLRI